MSLGDAHPYRGYYVDLSFVPSTDRQTVADLLPRARLLIGNVLDCWKSARMKMTTHSPMWMADWGNTGRYVTSIEVTHKAVILHTAEEDDSIYFG